MPSSASSSSSSSEDEPVEVVEGQGSSSDESAAPAAASERGAVGMWTWPCPRSYGKTKEMRMRLGALKPLDWDKETLSANFRNVLQKRRLLANLRLGRKSNCRAWASMDTDRCEHLIFFNYTHSG